MEEPPSDGDESDDRNGSGSGDGGEKKTPKKRKIEKPKKPAEKKVEQKEEKKAEKDKKPEETKEEKDKKLKALKEEVTAVCKQWAADPQRGAKELKVDAVVTAMVKKFGPFAKEKRLVALPHPTLPFISCSLFQFLILFRVHAAHVYIITEQCVCVQASTERNRQGNARSGWRRATLCRYDQA